MSVAEQDDGTVQSLGLRISISGIAHEFGFARETVRRRLEGAGVRPDGKERGYPIYRLRDAIPAVLAGTLAASGGVDDPDSLQPKERLDHYRAEHEKLKLDRARGDVVPVDEVRTGLAFVIKTVVQALETLPDVLERDCGLDPTAVARVEREFDGVRDELARQMEGDAAV